MNGQGADGPVALIGGRGALPATLFAALAGQGRSVLLCELDGFPFDGLDGHARIPFRLETLADLFDRLHAEGVAQVCLAGAIRRPVLDRARITPASAPLVARLAGAMTLGDDGALRTVIALFEEAGLTVTGAVDIAPDLLPPDGLLAGPPLYTGADADLIVARAAHADLAARDAGQAVVVRNGTVVATEGPEGTDAMLASLVPPRGPETGSGSPRSAFGTARAASGDGLAARPSAPVASRGLLYKAAKAGQDRRADLPVVGPGTVVHASGAGLCAIVIEAGGVMVLDRAQVVALAEGAGLTIEVSA